MKTYAPLHLLPLAQQFNCNIERNYFPLNSLRIFYLMLVRDLTNGDAVALLTTNLVVPKVSAIQDSVESLSESDIEDSQQIHESLGESRLALFEVIDTPQLRYDIEVTLQQVLIPRQFKELNAFINQPKQDTPASPDAALHRLLQIRNMNHFLYAQVISSIIAQRRQHNGLTPFHPRLNTDSVIRRCVSIIMQLNDLVDAICHAQNDLQSGSATLIELACRSVKPEGVEDLLRRILHTLQRELDRLPLSAPADLHVRTFAARLVDVLDGAVYDGT
ncbi:MAG: hypothetical protein IPO91_03400 [Chloroflexi bacterium]|nr:hypothetical protein [Chloroflexota bacterium]